MFYNIKKWKYYEDLEGIYNKSVNFLEDFYTYYTYDNKNCNIKQCNQKFDELIKIINSKKLFLICFISYLFPFILLWFVLSPSIIFIIFMNKNRISIISVTR